MNLVGLVILFPLLGTLLLGLGGRWMKRSWVSIVGCSSVGLSFLTSAYIFFDLKSFPASYQVFDKILFSWIPAGDFLANFGLYLDPLSTLMVLIVSGVGFIIHLYSVGYMAEDPRFSRYFAYLNLFVTSMLLLVLADNFLLLFMGWEGVGLCSYLLIGFWFHKKAAADAGKKAFLVNRVGDFGFMLGILLIYAVFKNLNYGVVFAQAPYILKEGGGIAVAITLLLFMGAIGKSAQIPLYVWLPDAMEGPTPVSALIHAATMVTAGVYMVARTHILFELAPVSLAVVAFVGVITALYSASIAMVQFDIKRILAYSTISQLGFMFLGVGTKAYSSGIFHLTTHAFFKSLLFLSAGSVMHATAGETDLRKLGGLRKYLPITFYAMLAGALALSGFPGTSGFFSKDGILAHAYMTPNYGKILWGLGLLTAGMTSFYIFRLIFRVFFGKKPEDLHPHESPKIMVVPLIVLSVLAIAGGYVGLPKLFGINLVQNFLSPVFSESTELTLRLEGMLMLAAVIFSGLGIAAAYYFYIVNPSAPKILAGRIKKLHNLAFNKYFVDEIYDRALLSPGRKAAFYLGNIFDIKFIDGAVNGVAKLVARNSEIWRNIQTGYVRNYALSILIGGLLVMGYLLMIR